MSHVSASLSHAPAYHHAQPSPLPPHRLSAKNGDMSLKQKTGKSFAKKNIGRLVEEKLDQYLQRSGFSKEYVRLVLFFHPCSVVHFNLTCIVGKSFLQGIAMIDMPLGYISSCNNTLLFVLYVLMPSPSLVSFYHAPFSVPLSKRSPLFICISYCTY